MYIGSAIRLLGVVLVLWIFRVVYVVGGLTFVLVSQWPLCNRSDIFRVIEYGYELWVVGVASRTQVGLQT